MCNVPVSEGGCIRDCIIFTGTIIFQKNLQAEVDTEVTNEARSEVIPQASKGTADPTLPSTVSTSQESSQKALLRESVSGDPIGKQSGGPAASVDKGAEIPSSNMYVYPHRSL